MLYQAKPSQAKPSLYFKLYLELCLFIKIMLYSKVKLIKYKEFLSDKIIYSNVFINILIIGGLQ